MNACPWRKDFYEKIGIQNDESIELMQEWLTALLKIIDLINVVFGQNPAYLKH
jgi:hypothetical protein